MNTFCSGTSNRDCDTQLLECIDTNLWLGNVLISERLVGLANTGSTRIDYVLTCACPDFTDARISVAVDGCLKKGARGATSRRGGGNEKRPLSTLKLTEQIPLVDLMKADTEAREDTEEQEDGKNAL